MRLGLEVELARGTVAAHLDVRRLVGADGDALVRKIRDGDEDLLTARLDALLALFPVLDGLGGVAESGAQRFRVVLFPLLEQLPQPLRLVLVLVPEGAHLGLEVLPLLVQALELREVDGGAPPLTELLGDEGEVLGDELEIQHRAVF